MDACVELAMENILEHGVGKRVNAMKGFAGSLPLDDSIADFVINRGSILFREDQEKGFNRCSGIESCGIAPALSVHRQRTSVFEGHSNPSFFCEKQGHK